MTRKIVSILLASIIFSILAQPSLAEEGDLSPGVFPSLAPISKEDVEGKASSSGKGGDPVKAVEKISVFVSVVCEHDAELEKTIRTAVEDRLRLLGGFTQTDTMEDASVLFSFVGFRVVSKGEALDRIVYSFAYGMPDLAFVDSKLIAIPRYLYHEPVMITEDKLGGKIGGNVEAANRDFMEPLRR